MKNPTMLYKSPGPHEIHGGHFDYITVDEDEIEDALADGWHLTTPDAKAAHEAAKAEAAEASKGDTGAPSRKEMMDAADKLGLTYAHNISNVKLAELLDAAQKA